MYDYIYFDLDDTLMKDNPVTGKSELMESGLAVYKELRKKYPLVPFYLFTNRKQNEIKYDKIYFFDKAIGDDEMRKFIMSNRVFPHRLLLNLNNLRIFITGNSLFKKGATAKVLYLFLRHTLKNEKVLVIDDDKRVARLFR